jgi:redox-sensitive bicupin YhaK (pirin superfamily)
MIALEGKTHYLGDGFFVTRLLPDIARRSVGPFLFFDYFGPVAFAPGKGVDVRPHPHIGLATITYLFEGSQMHRDTLGSVQEILPGDVNWMTAGLGIAHSERTGPEARTAGHRLHGIQTWVGLPTADEETGAHFQHFKAAQLPEMEQQDVKLRLMAGSAFGLAAPVKVFSPMFYADARFDTGGAFTFPDEHEERAIFITEGRIQINAETHNAGKMLVLDKDEVISMFAEAPARAILFGGAPLDGPRHIWWNFVSSSRERIERAKQEWKDGKFGLIPGDDQEFIPLPEEKKPAEEKK